MTAGPQLEEPNVVAHKIAGDFWPDVQEQTLVTKGIYNFMCTGHGGMVAVIGSADLPSAAVAAARRHKLIELVAIVKLGSETKIFSSATSSREDVERLGAGANSELVEVWVGEEDCDWATLAAVSPACRAGMRDKLGISEEHATLDGALASLERWNEDFLADITETCPDVLAQL